MANRHRTSILQQQMQNASDNTEHELWDVWKTTNPTFRSRPWKVKLLNGVRSYPTKKEATEMRDFAKQAREKLSS